MAAALKPRTTKKRIQLRESGGGVGLHVEPVLRAANSADTKYQEIGFPTSRGVVRWCASEVVSGTAAFVDARATERADPFERALTHAS